MWLQTSCSLEFHSAVATPFLRNLRDVISAMDFLVVPTARFKLLYVRFVIGHARREILHFNVKDRPTASWVIQQVREAFPDETSIRFLIHDNHSIFSDRVDELITSFGIEPKRTAFRSRWQNGLAEPWVGTVKRDLLDHVIVIDEHHLRRSLGEYVAYYSRERVHTRLRDAPAGRTVETRPSPRTNRRTSAQGKNSSPLRLDPSGVAASAENGFIDFERADEY